MSWVVVGRRAAAEKVEVKVEAVTMVEAEVEEILLLLYHSQFLEVAWESVTLQE